MSEIDTKYYYNLFMCWGIYCPNLGSQVTMSDNDMLNNKTTINKQTKTNFPL